MESRPASITSSLYELLAGVAITPGRDFGDNDSEKHVRFAYTTSLENLKEGVRRIKEFL